MAVMKITQENFDLEVTQADKPVLLDFWAEWCGPCRAVAPVVDEVAAELIGHAKVGKVNVDEQPGLAAAFNVMSIPTLVVIKNGSVVSMSVGAKPKAEILDMVLKETV
ncbi:MAG: thioredoxin [Clostridiales bacterium]|jgi:thioredoxin 1|nr:thioredoxin [Clostridiales bacterium]